MKRTSSPILLVALVALALSTTAAQAALKLPALFGDHMVLQAGKPIHVWGTADPGSRVNVALGIDGTTREGQAQAGPGGIWEVDLDPIEASAKSGELTITESTGDKKVINDVLVGEVWVCSGQSNMAFRLVSCKTGAEEIPNANYPLMRYFRVSPEISYSPLDDVSGRWVTCTPDTAKNFSAAAYYFGRELLETLKRPVGLIGTYWGGTPAQAWTSLDALAADPALADYVTQREDSLKNMDKNMERYRKVFLTKWEKDKAAWEEQKRTDPENAPARAPRKPTSPDRNPRVPSVLFNAMVHPLLNYPIRGVIWYQAEANSHNDADAQLYATLFPAMIEDWRSRWGQGDFPFLFVQLPGFDGLHGIVEMRKSQTETLSLPNTGMAVAIDLGEKKDIHPKRKLEVGDRLARIALRDVYGQSIVASGPQPESASRDGSTVKLTMQDETGKLLIKGDSLNGFELAGEDGVYYPAQAQLEGMAVVLSSDKVSQPQSIRYAWARYPDATLFNAEELPAAPFQFEIIPAKQ